MILPEKPKAGLNIAREIPSPTKLNNDFTSSSLVASVQTAVAFLPSFSIFDARESRFDCVRLAKKHGGLFLRGVLIDEPLDLFLHQYQ